MGSATDPWRVAQARHRNRADECGQVYGQEARTTVARLEDFPSQSCGWDRCDRSVRRADNLVSFALWTAIVGHGRRQIVWLGVTAHPTAEWIANQITEAFGWERAPHYLIRDRDQAYGNVFIR